MEFDRSSGVYDVLAAPALVVAAHLLAKGHTVEDGAAQHEHYILEHDAGLLGAELAKFLPEQGANILALYEHLARGGLDEAVDVT